jgi:hypothetical protein
MMTGMSNKASGGGGNGGNSGGSNRSNITVTKTHHIPMNGFHFLNSIDPFLVNVNVDDNSFCSILESNSHKFLSIDASSTSSDDFVSFHDVELVYELDAWLLVEGSLPANSGALILSLND